MEENKVAQKLGKLIQDFVGSYTGTCNRCKKHECSHCESGGMCEDVTRGCDRLADAILQSPDLLVTLVEPKYSLQTFGGNMTTVERDGKWIATFDSRSDAEAFKNSKEPK